MIISEGTKSDNCANGGFRTINVAYKNYQHGKDKSDEEITEMIDQNRAETIKRILAKVDKKSAT